ncbi:unnamed protein product [Medioppia subpectinata]|uniref:Phosphoenolpyruvate synthase n=1 Tax=Medioppia subpectinata TaxID=1979941 RepID=A0A7R9KLD9_9ACAR|nr:unnamed protein product [Medioppia subpectinata]CAG2105604.1 unnamed protein product [Medioppia subpectinata]
MPSLVKECIKNALKSFDPNGNDSDILVAVRSSACGEDSEDMSAAGQMSTYLGVKGLEDICNNVLKCWSSQFNVIAVEYKRGYGQIVNTPMAVVVQQMIDCDVAGVMFTCDPLNGAPNKITINANYGIGESVVSATVNPDNISLLVDMESNSYDTQWDIKSIDSVVIGAKETAIRISKKSVSGGTEVEQNISVKDKCCLSDEQMRKLGEIGLKIQKCFGCERDIEWGLKDGKYYLFQSRPVTHLHAMNEWELSHELDTGHLDESEYNTRANLGEVMPGALSPLYLTSLTRAMWLSISGNILNSNGLRYVPHRRLCQSVSISNYAVFFSLKDVNFLSFFAFAPEEYEDFTQKALVLAAFGHPVDDIQLREDSFERNGIPSMKIKLSKQKDAFLSLFSKKELKSLIKRKDGLNFVKESNYKNSKEIFKVFADNMTLISECLDIHLKISTKSSIYNLMLLTILSNGNIDVKTNTNLLPDFANVLSTTGNSIVSADVPAAMKSLAKSIKDPQSFKQKSPEEALEWLENNNEETGELYKQFMENYGFRGYKEWDLLTTTWSRNRLLLVTTLQTMVPLRESQSPSVLTKDELISRIKSPITRKQKYLLKNWILPACQRSVADREASKQFDIKYPKIVMKAKQRKKIYPKLDKYVYDEMSIGPNIRPRNYMDKKSQSEAYMNGENDPGDILVTYSTDIGWSPYLPMISGIATEIGGLVSHGAVIAREYGIPCLVGVENACHIITNGETILLDADNGLIVLMAEQDSQDSTNL